MTSNLLKIKQLRLDQINDLTSCFAYHFFDASK